MALSSLPSSVAASVGRSVASSVASSSVGTTLRWGATHGLMRAAIRRQVRAGNPDARLLLDPVLQADPFPHYETLRASCPFAIGAFARLTVHHDVSTAVLRSDDFGVTHPDAGRARAGAGGARRSPARRGTRARSSRPRCWRSTRRTTPATAGWSAGPSPRTRVAALRDRTTEIAKELLDEMDRAARAATATVDLVARLREPAAGHRHLRDARGARPRCASSS